MYFQRKQFWKTLVKESNQFSGHHEKEAVSKIYIIPDTPHRLLQISPWKIMNNEENSQKAKPECISFSSLTKNLRKINLQEERFILARDFRGFSPQTASSIVMGLS